MPVLEATEKIAPRSALRHRPLDSSLKTLAPVIPRASRTRAISVDGADEQVSEWRHATGETKKARETQRKPDRVLPPPSKTPSAKARRQYWKPMHPLIYLSLGMLVAMCLWTCLTVALGWFTTLSNDLHYGRPRTFQTDAWVGHNEQTGVPSHFIAVNLNRHIQIIEIQGGDPAHTRIYVGPQFYNAGDELTPVTLSFLDVNGDHRPDMLISFQTSRVVFINVPDGFRPLEPAEQAGVEQFLQRQGR